MNPRSRALAAAGLLALLAACATDQRADVDAYRAISDPPGPVPTQAEGDPLPLVRALRLTAAHNERLAQQGEVYIQALADRQRLAAALRPTVSLFTNVGMHENTGSDGVVQTDVGVNGQYRLLTGMTDLRNVRAAEAFADSARWLILDLRESLLVQTARAYYDAIRAERLADVLTNSVRAQEERLADARGRNEVGFARPLDVAQIEAQVSRTRARLIDARRQAGEARSTLALLVNARVTGSALTDEFESPGAAPSVDDAFALARAHRQDVLSARAEAEAARALVDAAIGEYEPAITLNLDFFLVRAPDDAPASIASLLGVRAPVFSGGRIAADVRGAWSRFRESVLVYRARAREVARDVETAHLRFAASLELSAELAAQVRVAAQAVELAEAAYGAGLGTNLERVVAQDQLLAAELEAVSAAYDAKTAYLELLRACGLLGRDMIGARLPPPPAALPVPDSPFLNRSSDPAPAAGGAS
ncbi:MAG TPA: TolC family protein [Phycisphaerales bacterium]|nr:TolC family protein [Phycisphaerales bacterium]